MFKIQTIIFLALACIAASSRAEIAIIVHPQSAVVMSHEDIKGVFLAKINSFPNGKIAVPIMQDTSSDSNRIFLASVIKKSPQQMKAYWSRRFFTGQGIPPKEVSNDADVIKLVADNPNIIGYVNTSALTPNVHVVATY